MPIEEFDYKLFAKNLSSQVEPALPPEIAEHDRQYIVNIVHNFCFMAGEALYKESNTTLNVEQACTITQFIGEWAFHKAVDCIKSGIDPQFRDGILQNIAFTVFEIAKTAIVKQLPQEDMAPLVEHHVKKAYDAALQDLKNKGVLTEEQYEKAVNQSNIDDMAKMQAQEQYDQVMQDAEQYADAAVGNQKLVDNSTKLLKLATFAMVLKYLPQEKRQGVLSRFSPEDANLLEDYSSMTDLENKLDKSLVVKCLNEIKNTLPEPKKINPAKVNARLYKIVKNSDISKISNMMNKERLFVKNYVTTAGSDDNNPQIPPRVADIICNYLEEKLNV